MLHLEYLLTWLVHRYGGTSQRGASLVEYVLMVSLIAMVCLAAMSYFGGGNGGSLDRSSNLISSAG